MTIMWGNKYGWCWACHQERAEAVDWPVICEKCLKSGVAVVDGEVVIPNAKEEK